MNLVARFDWLYKQHRIMLLVITYHDKVQSTAMLLQVQVNIHSEVVTLGLGILPLATVQRWADVLLTVSNSWLFYVADYR